MYEVAFCNIEGDARLRKTNARRLYIKHLGEVRADDTVFTLNFEDG